MTLRLNRNNAGPSGSNLTLSSSGQGGTAYNLIVAGGADVSSTGSPDIQFTNELASAGLPIVVKIAPNGVNYLRWNTTDTGRVHQAMFTLYYTDTPTALQPIVEARGSGGNPFAFVTQSGTRRPFVRYLTTDLISSQPPTNLDVNTLYRVWVTWIAESASGAGDGSISVRIENNSGTVVHAFGASSLSTGVVLPNHYRFGASNALASGISTFFGPVATDNIGARIPWPQPIVDSSPIKTWNGTAYVNRKLMRWNGSGYSPVSLA